MTKEQKEKLLAYIEKAKWLQEFRTCDYGSPDSLHILDAEKLVKFIDTILILDNK
jgi:hypothetical protein